MPNRLFSWDSGTPASNETAKLLKDIGDWIGMDYGCDGSGAWTENGISVFRNRLGYSGGGIFRSLSITDAKSIVRDDIVNGRPVIMDGYHSTYTYTTGWWLWKKTHTGYSNGHAWICDGYKVYQRMVSFRLLGRKVTTNLKRYFYHMNWGWSGQGMGSTNNNGWFRFDNLEIDGSTIKGENANFQHNRKYLTGIRP